MKKTSLVVGRSARWGFASLLVFSFIAGGKTYGSSELPAVAPGRIVECQALLAKLSLSVGIDPIELAGISQDQLVRAELERRTLLEFLEPSFSRGTPLSFMSAAERTVAVILSQGVSTEFDPTSLNGTTKVYNLFSGGVEVAGGRRIIGQQPGVLSSVQQAMAKASGNTTGKYPSMAVGMPGSGKSYMLEILSVAFTKLGINDPRFYIYTFLWKNLEIVPALEARFSTGDGRTIELPAQMTESPFALLPADLQNQYLALITPEVQKLIRVTPNPKRLLNPRDAGIRAKLLEHYQAKADHSLSNAEILDILSRHVEVVRAIPGRGNMPHIPKQSKDVDNDGLFGAPNALVRAQFGPGDFAAYNLNGRIPQANGFPLFLDELGKNPPDLLGNYLNMIQDGTVSIGGRPTTIVDFVTFTATNIADWKTIQAAAAANGEPSPLLDRLVPTVWRYTLLPRDAERILYLERQDIRARPLPLNEDSPGFLVTGQTLDRLYPPIEQGRPVITTDGRFDLTVQHPDAKNGVVHVSPHTLQFLANWAVLTRHHFGEVPAAMGKFPIAEEPVYRDPVARLRALNGLDPQFDESKRRSLAALSIKAGAGLYGVTNRDLGKIFASAVNLVASEGRECVTPADIQAIMRSSFIHSEMPVSDEDSVKWLSFAELVYRHFTVAGYERDLQLSMFNDGNSVLERVYDDVLQELIMLGSNSSATEYQNANKEMVPIRKDRLDKIRQLYRETVGRELDAGELALFLRAGIGASSATPRDQNLLAAIARWQADNLQSGIDATYGSILNLLTQGNAGGDTRLAEKGDAVVSTMHKQHGYCPHCARTALKAIQKHQDWLKAQAAKAAGQ